MGILNWRLNGRRRASPHSSRELEALAQEICRLSPRLRLLPRYAQRLAPHLGTALDYVRTLIAGIPAPREASPQAWATDPYVHACFGTPHDVQLIFSRSADLQQFFETSPDATEAFAVLGMDMTEKRTLGVGLEGDVMRTDVLQTIVNFSDHQVRLCGRDKPALCRQIEGRMLDQLALQGLASAAAGGVGRDRRLQEMALLGKRLRFLEGEGEGVGMRAMLGGAAAPDPDEQARLRAQLAEGDANARTASVSKDSVNALESQLLSLQTTFSDAKSYFFIERRHIRLSRMNVVTGEDSMSPSDALEFTTASIPGDPPATRTFLMVRIPRAVMLTRMRLLEEAERYL